MMFHSVGIQIKDRLYNNSNIFIDIKPESKAKYKLASFNVTGMEIRDHAMDKHFIE